MDKALNSLAHSLARLVRQLPLLLLPVAAFAVALLCGAPVQAEPAAPALADTVRELAARQWQDGAAAPAGLRYEIEVGTLDEHLRLAPCARIEPQWPAGVRPWGKVRVALRCTEGPTPWKVYLPVTVHAFGRAVVAAATLPAGTVLEARHLAEAEVDLAAGTGTPLRTATPAVGRTLARALVAGQPLRGADLRQRQWFAIGDTVRIVAVGPGYQVGGEGQAVTPGIEGQASRVRTESGRVVTGRAVGERLLEVAL